jgi:hypothetical protein
MSLVGYSLPELSPQAYDLTGSVSPRRLFRNGGIDLEALVGKLADLEVIHDNTSAKHKDALRLVQGIYPPYQLVKSGLSLN